MIMRIWRGATRAAHAEAYHAYLLATGIPAYRATPGNCGAQIVRRIQDDRAEFLTISLWSSWDSIRAFAGDDIARAVFYPEDDYYLVERDTTVSHYEVLVDERP